VSILRNKQYDKMMMMTSMINQLLSCSMLGLLRRQDRNVTPHDRCKCPITSHSRSRTQLKVSAAISRLIRHAAATVLMWR